MATSPISQRQATPVPDLQESKLTLRELAGGLKHIAKYLSQNDRALKFLHSAANHLGNRDNQFLSARLGNLDAATNSHAGQTADSEPVILARENLPKVLEHFAGAVEDTSRANLDKPIAQVFDVAA